MAPAASSCDRSASIRRYPRGPASCARIRARGPRGGTGSGITWTTMERDVVSTVRAAVKRWLDRPSIVACSGGADSIALADAADGVIVTVDHGMRAGSEVVAEAVRAWAQGRGMR